MLFLAPWILALYATSSSPSLAAATEADANLILQDAKHSSSLRAKNPENQHDGAMDHPLPPLLSDTTNDETMKFNKYLRNRQNHFGLMVDGTTNDDAPSSEIGLRFQAAADTCVRKGSFASRNYGSSKSLVVKKNTQVSFLRFENLPLLSPSAEVTAKLYLNPISVKSTTNIAISQWLGPSWIENTLTWDTVDLSKANKGAATSIRIKKSDGRQWQVIDVTRLLGDLQGENGNVSFLLESKSGGKRKSVSFNSRESSGLEPFLLLEPVIKELFFNCTADTYIRDGEFSSNGHGSETSLLVETGVPSNNQITFLRFDSLPQYSSRANFMANLHLYLTDKGPGSETEVVISQWLGLDLESSWTWDTANVSMANKGENTTVRFTPQDVGDWQIIDVTSLLDDLREESGVVNFVLESHTSGTDHKVTFKSRENAGFEPFMAVQPATNEFVYPCTADTYIRDGRFANCVHGLEDAVGVKLDASSYNRAAFLRFENVIFQPLSIFKVHLHLYLADKGDGAITEIEIYQWLGPWWDESSLTWNTADTSSSNRGLSTVVRLTPADVGDWHVIDVTSLVGDIQGVVSFLLLSNTRGSQHNVIISSRERNGLGPFLSLDAPAQTKIPIPDPTPDPTPAPESFFEDGPEGWTTYNDASLYFWNITGGNPGGCFSAKDDVAGLVWYFRAPSKFHGNFSDSYGLSLRYDLRQVPDDQQFDNGNRDVVITGTGGVEIYHKMEVSQYPGTQWTSYSIPLSVGNWKLGDTNNTAQEADIRAVLWYVTDILIRGEYRTGPDLGSLDNVVMETHDNPNRF